MNFEDNLVNAEGAGINIGNSGKCVLNLEIKNSRFTNNNGGALGAGAIRIFHYTGVNTKNNVLIHNCVFNNNTGAYSIIVPPPPYNASCYTHILNSTFVNNSRYVFNKNWSPDFDYVNSYNFMDIYNCVIIDTTALKRMFYNNSFNPFTMHDYRVNHCLISKPDCIFDGQSICGDQMLYNVDPEFEDNSFIPKECSPLVNAGNNFGRILLISPAIYWG
ncbi:MAG: hypothetical protein IPH31_08495 [Lewinellaceae bacterium]|nr:hypothetical protein [Lewinellaceae bacterium]